MADKAGYTFKFIEKPPRLFKCELCGLVLRDAQLTECCGKNVCRPCIAKVVEKEGPCPIVTCTESHVKMGTVNRALRFEILESIIYCPMKEAGCPWQDKLELVDSHLEEQCDFAEEQCKNLCGVSIRRRQVKAHEAVCERHLIECHQCGEVNERRNQPHHMKVCPLSTTKCPFSIVGCTSEVLNKDLKRHFEKFLSEHYSLVTRHGEAVSAAINGSKQALSVEISKTLDPQIVEATTVCDEVMGTSLEIAELKKHLEEAEKEFEELQKKHKQISRDIFDLSGEVEASICTLSVDQSMAASEAQVRCYGPAMPKFCAYSRPLTSPRVIEEYFPSVSYTIREFYDERQNDSCLYLPPFFSQRGGYKMSLIVYCNGCESQRGNCLSIFVAILKGPYDGNLKWPMIGKVVVELVSMVTTNVQKTIEIKVASPVWSDDIPHSGTICGQSAPFNQNLFVQPSKYINNGCLNIKVANCSINC